MKTGFAISILLHVVLLAWAVVKITTPREFKTNEIKSVSVEFTTIEELTRIKAGKKDAKKSPKPPKKIEKPKPKPKTKVKSKPKKVKKVAVLPPKPKKAAPLPKPKKVKPKPKPKPKKVVKKTEPKKKVIAKKKPVPKKRKKKKSFDPDKISALLNKIPNAASAQKKAVQPQAKKTPPKSRPAGRGRPEGRDARMTMNEIDAFRAQISRCWNPPIGGLGADRLVVRMRLKLKLDGMLAQPPKLMNSQSSPFFAAASDAALRAVWQCQPYEMPRKKYAVWRDMVLNFDPREMFQ